VHPDKQHPRRHHKPYRTLSDSNTNSADPEILSRQFHRRFNVFRYLLCIVSDLPKSDLLYSLLIGMLHHLQKCIFHFIKTHEGLNKYNAIWLSVPAYHDLTPQNKSYEEDSRMEGEGDEGNEPVPACSCNPVSMRRKPRSSWHIQSRN